MKTESAWAVVDQPSSDVPVRQKNAGLHRGWPQMIFDNMLATRGCLPCSRNEGNTQSPGCEYDVFCFQRRHLSSGIPFA
jgi:hypothetical protein